MERNREYKKVKRKEGKEKNQGGKNKKKRKEPGKAEAHKAIKQCLTFSLFLNHICLINKLIP